jgi:hypothetical protein
MAGTRQSAVKLSPRELEIIGLVAKEHFEPGDRRRTRRQRMDGIDSLEENFRQARSYLTSCHGG